MPDRFRGELLTMGRYTNPTSFPFTSSQFTHASKRDVQRIDEVVRLDAAEMIPALMIAAAQQSGVVDTAAIVDVRQIVADAADVREVDVLFHDAFATAH